MDKAWHFVAGFLISQIGYGFARAQYFWCKIMEVPYLISHDLSFAFLWALIAGLGKEGYDIKTGKGVYEIADIWATCFGGGAWILAYKIFILF